MPSLELKLLGGFRARLSSGELLAIPSRKGQLLLAFLALRPGEALAREKLIGLLWSDRADSQARGSLRQELTTLRKILSMVEPQPIVIGNESLQLEAGTVDVDVLEFQKLIRSDNPADLEQAVAMYTGPFLGEFLVKDPACAEWLAQERERLAGLATHTLRRLLVHRTNEGALDQAVALAELMLSHDPLLEDIHRRLMELYARLGRYSSALKQYRICQSILASELSEAPEPATTQLYERIRDQRAASERSLPAIGSAQRAGSPGMPLSGTAKGEASRQASATEAAELYQMGRSYFLRNIWGKRALEAARQLFLQAIEIDPGFARAYAGLADCDCYGVLLGMPGASNDAIADNSLRALELDPNSPEALAARGLALYVMNQHTEANAYFERAVRLGPELFEAHYFYARNCRVLGQHERAAVLFERAATLNKNDYRALGLLSDEYRAIGRLGDSLKAARACLERIIVEVAAQPDDGHALSFGAIIQAELGEWGRAEEWLARAVSINADDPIVNYNLACAYAQLGRSEDAIQRLKATFDSPEINRRAFLDWMREDSALDPVRAHPDFRSLMAGLEAGARPPGADEASQFVIGDRVAIAVLPFETIGDDQTRSFFADGLTEDIITDLSRVTGLVVISRSAVSKFKGQAADVRDVARALCVRYVLEGRARVTQNRLNLTTELVDGFTGACVRADRYDRVIEDPIQTQNETSRSIVEALMVTLLPEKTIAAAAQQTKSAEARQHYLIGRTQLLARGLTVAGLQLARRSFEKAVEIDPHYARAHAGIANADSLLLWRGDTSVSIEDVLRTSENAMRLEPELPEAHVAKGLALFMAGSNEAAAAVLAEAVRLGPSLFEAHYVAGRNCQVLGRYAEAAAHFDRAAEIMPDDYRSPGLAAGAYGELGRRADMQSAARRCIERCNAEIAVHPDNADAIAFGAAVLTESGDIDQGRDWIVRAEALQPADSVAIYNLSAAHAAIGSVDSAVRGLERILTDSHLGQQKHFIRWLARDSSFDPIRNLPEFVALMQRVHGGGRAQEAEVRRPPTIAVLAFRNLSGNREQQYIADGLTEDIITDLSRMRRFNVVSSGTKNTSGAGGMDLKDIARNLSAQFVLEGAVKATETMVSATAKLVDGATGACLWADRYDRDPDALLETQQEISRKIVEALSVKLLPDELAAIVRPRTSDPEAQRLYDMGRSYFRQRGGGAALRVARNAFARAAEIDPAYARAHAGVAYCDADLLCRGDPTVSLERVLKTCDRAVALEPGLADGYAARGLAFYAAGRLEEAGAALAEALRLAPNLYEAHFFTARCRRAQGRLVEAVTHFERAAELQPTCFRTLGLAASIYRQLGRRDEELQTARRCIERCRAEIAVAPDNTDALAKGAAMLAELGEVEEARQWMARTEGLQTDDLVTNYSLALAHALLGEADRAIVRLRRVFSGSPTVHRVHAAWLKHDRSFDSLRDHPGFVELTRQVENGTAIPQEPLDRAPTLAVLPFESPSGDPAQQYVADGVVDEITAALSRVRSFFVIARGSTLRYRDRPLELSVIGRELGVRYLLQGSVGVSGDRVRIAVQLVEPEGGAKIWAQLFEGCKDDIFDLQDEIAVRVVGVIAPMIRTAEMERLRRKRPENMAAYDSVVRALPQLLSMSETASREALRLSMEATRFDPGYARAYALAAWCHSWRISNDWVESRGEARSEGMRVAREALRLNDEDPGVLIEAGTAEATLLGNVEAAAIHVAKALAIDPNSASGWIRSGYLQAFLGHTDQALEQFERAGRLSPFDPLTFYLQSGRALAHFIAGRYLEAAEWSGMALTERPGLPWGLRILAASQQMLGRRDDAAAAARRLLAESPTASIATALECMPFRSEDARQRFAGALRAAGVSERGTGAGNLKVVA